MQLQLEGQRQDLDAIVSEIRQKFNEDAVTINGPESPTSDFFQRRTHGQNELYELVVKVISGVVSSLATKLILEIVERYRKKVTVKKAEGMPDVRTDGPNQEAGNATS